MAILKIARMGHPVLRQPAPPVADPAAPDITRLVADMKDTLIDIGGNGLAAPQVYVSQRVVLYRLAAERIPPGAKQPAVDWTALVNPVITPLGDGRMVNYERCLSLPDMVGKVERHTKVRCAYETLEGKRVEMIAGGFHAMVLQHECDHLDGVLYPMRMRDLSEFGYGSEWKVPDFIRLWSPEAFDGPQD
ncbi:MAG: peptide deformylase [Alphaproteobacteria bacterium]|nr:peptide deformylase [Alphaproteobacteria bacterium]